MKHRLRIWLIERLGGVDKPLPANYVLDYAEPCTTESSGDAMAAWSWSSLTGEIKEYPS